MSMRSVRADHAEAKHSCDFVSIRCLKSNRHLLFARNEICRNRIFGVEEMNWTTFLDRLVANFLALNENIERSFPPFITIVTHDQGHGMRWINRQIEREPLSTAAERSAHNSIVRCVFALHVEIPFRLHFPGLRES